MEVAIRQTTVCSCIPTAIDKSIAHRWTWHYRVLNRAFERLERPTGKLVRAVLRGLGGSNPSRLPDWRNGEWRWITPPLIGGSSNIVHSSKRRFIGASVPCGSAGGWT